MSLFSALMASVSGMQGQATMLSTISDNISNSNTTGYKEASTSFEDMLSQVSTTSYTAGGVGTKISYGISTQGDLASASSSTDLAISGNGFFVVQDASGTTYLTRAGDFSANSSGELVNSEGYTLMGYPISSTSTSTPSSVSQLTPITISTGDLAPTATTSGTLTANLPSSDAIDTGTLPSANTSASTYSEESQLTTYDDLGNAVTLNVYFTKTASNTWEVDVYNAADASSSGGFPYSSAALSTQTLSFSGTTGDLTSGSPLTFTVPGGQAVSVDVSGMTQVAGTSLSTSTNSMNGNAPSAYSSISIGTDGTVSEVYANGTTVAIAKIPLATVASVDSLTPHAGQTYSANINSGNIVLGSADSEGFGSINSNELESSTVDLATQLTEMVIAQNAYSANSKAFQTGGTMLTTLINMISNA
jgi:flagellar hook protein FlgE